jgi:hypothetical protein
MAFGQKDSHFNTLQKKNLTLGPMPLEASIEVSMLV